MKIEPVKALRPHVSANVGTYGWRSNHLLTSIDGRFVIRVQHNRKLDDCHLRDAVSEGQMLVQREVAPAPALAAELTR